MRVLLMRLRAPLMAFGEPAVDDVSPAGSWPTRSMLTGLLGCAQGYRRHHVDHLGRLQARLVYAVRRDQEPRRMVDLQTARLDTEDMRGTQLTPQGWASYREDQWVRGNPVMRHREFLMDGDYLVALALDPAAEPPTVDDLAHKLDFPEGVLTIGRRPCVPSKRINAGLVEADSLLAALRIWQPPKAASVAAIWPESEGEGGRLVEVVEDRDWRNELHGGRRRMREGQLTLSAQ
jgi:CRISPR system Cascade subunit CasD